MRLIPVGSEFAMVDDADYDDLIKHTWSLVEWKGKQYAKRKQIGRKEVGPRWAFMKSGMATRLSCALCCLMIL